MESNCSTIAPPQFNEEPLPTFKNQELKVVFKSLKRHLTKIILNDSGIDFTPKGRNFSALALMQKNIEAHFASICDNSEQLEGISNVICKLLAPSLVLRGSGVLSTKYRRELRILQRLVQKGSRCSLGKALDCQVLKTIFNQFVESQGENSIFSDEKYVKYSKVIKEQKE